MRRIYCYVDESGQDTQGLYFVVSVVVAGEERDSVLMTLEKIERETGKNKLKWTRATFERRCAYMERVLKIDALRGKLQFSFYQNTRDYFGLTIKTIFQTLAMVEEQNYKATVLIDALPPKHAIIASRMLHKAGAQVKKVRGVKHDENDALIRLADAVCGFVRNAYEGQVEMKKLFDEAIQKGVLRDLRL